MGLPCLSCKQDVSPAESKLFAEVYLCSNCFTIAERLFRKGEAELRMMLLVLKESIRLAALKGQLQFSLQDLDDMKKEDLVSHLAKLAAEARAKAVPHAETDESVKSGTVQWKRQRKILESMSSPEPTSPPVLPAAGSPSTDSTSE